MSKNLVCIDIGSNLTKVLEGNLNKGVLEVLSLNSFKTPYKDNDIYDASLFEQLIKLIPLDKLKASNIALSIPPNDINFTILELPKMPKEDLDKAVKGEAKRKILPAPADEDIFNYSVLAESKVKDTIKLNILVGAGRKSEIIKRLLPFQKAGIVPGFVGSTALALIMYFYEFKPNPTENWALIDIGFKNTNIIIFNKNDVALIRNIRFACFDFIEAAAKKSNLSFDKTEELFLREQLREELIHDSWQYLLSELRRSFAYYKEITQGQRIDSILFSGGMFKIKQSAEFLRKNMGGNLELFELSSSKYISVDRFTPGDLAGFGSSFATALGLGFSFKPLKKATLNFLPSEVYRERRLKQIKFFSVQILSIIAITLLIVIASIFIRINVSRNQINESSSSFSEPEYAKVSKEASKINLSLGNLNKQKDLINKIFKYEFYPGKILAIISKAIPDTVYIKEIEIGYSQNDSGVESVDDPMLLKKQSKKKKEITVTLRAVTSGDYELAKEQSENFYKAFLDSEYFFDLNLEPIKLEEIVVKGKSGQGRITEIREREFKISAKAKIK